MLLRDKAHTFPVVSDLGGTRASLRDLGLAPIPSMVWERTWNWCGQLSERSGFTVNRPGYWFFHLFNDEFNFYTSHRSSRGALPAWGAQSGLDELARFIEVVKVVATELFRVRIPLTSP